MTEVLWRNAGDLLVSQVGRHTKGVALYREALWVRNQAAITGRGHSPPMPPASAGETEEQLDGHAAVQIDCRHNRTGSTEVLFGLFI